MASTIRMPSGSKYMDQNICMPNTTTVCLKYMDQNGFYPCHVVDFHIAFSLVVGLRPAAPPKFPRWGGGRIRHQELLQSLVKIQKTWVLHRPCVWRWPRQTMGIKTYKNALGQSCCLANMIASVQSNLAIFRELLIFVASFFFQMGLSGWLFIPTSWNLRHRWAPNLEINIYIIYII